MSGEYPCILPENLDRSSPSLDLATSALRELGCKMMYLAQSTLTVKENGPISQTAPSPLLHHPA